MKIFRWSAVFLTSVFASYIGTYLYTLNAEPIARFLGIDLAILHTLRSQIYVYLFLVCSISISIYFVRTTIKKYIFIYPHIGALGYQANIKTIFTKTIFERKSLFNQLKSDVDLYIKDAKDIDLLMINGSERSKDPFEDYVIKQAQKAMNVQNKIVNIFLLSPKSEFVEIRADERYQDKKLVQDYIDTHQTSLRRICTKFPGKVYLYDEYPVWRIFRLGNIMYVSRYVEGLPAKESFSFGYVKPHGSTSRLTDNAYSSFMRFLKHLKSKARDEKTPLIRYIELKVTKDKATGKEYACDCYWCLKDMAALFEKKLRKNDCAYSDVMDSDECDEIYKDVSEKVYCNKHCCSLRH